MSDRAGRARPLRRRLARTADRWMKPAIVSSGASAQRIQDAAIERDPLGQPRRREAHRVGRDDEVHAHGAGRHHLLPFRDLGVRPRARDHRQDGGGAREAVTLQAAILFLAGAGIVGQDTRPRSIAPTRRPASASITRKRQGASLP